MLTTRSSGVVTVAETIPEQEVSTCPEAARGPSWKDTLTCK